MSSHDGLKAKLRYKRFVDYDLEGETLMLVELSARDASDIWPDLEQAEQTGSVIDAYSKIVLCSVFTSDGDRLFHDIDEVKSIPVRLIVPMAEQVMKLCDLSLDEKKTD